jgi:hypothetical protein
MSKTESQKVHNAMPITASSIEPITLPPLSSQPLVSVLIANYNYARFVPTALESLLNQSYPNWEAIVCDDGSTDNSVEVIENFCKQDSRIHLIRKANGGQNSAYNACYEKASGEIICLLDADDVFGIQKIQKVVAAFRLNPEAGLCNHFCQVIDAAGTPLPVTMHRFFDSGWLAEKALSRGACVYVPITSCMAFRREVGELLFPVTPLQERDLDGYLAMVAQFLAQFCVIDEKLSDYRIHGNNMGGITEPTPDRLQYELRLITQRTSNVKDFVAQRFGENIAAQIKMEDNPQYIQAALKLLAIEGQDGRLQQARALIAHHPSAKWRAIWRLIFAFPEVLSRSAVPLMHRSHKAKSLVHNLLGREKAVTQ